MTVGPGHQPSASTHVLAKAPCPLACTVFWALSARVSFGLPPPWLSFCDETTHDPKPTLNITNTLQSKHSCRRKTWNYYVMDGVNDTPGISHAVRRETPCNLQSAVLSMRLQQPEG